ncbi:ABC transporter substrate-binding protein [Amaricoccus sp.]|uniref:ABC transporter substrate-binding protein n=1 Tax=Amaricoccus sp. TaxID=1872485 RepID=UPI001B6D4D7D|nr:ABC transporter substrate-binding protein [Amaricoccus sp.]MBP7000673.1 ABC transporter substrate-binding protein [Amaricoccus sp.]
MKKVLFLTSALASFGLAAAAQEITIVSWGGAYGASQVEAYHKPYMALTGVKINSVDADNPATPIKAQVEAGNVTIDVADVEPSDLVRLCDEGALEVLAIDELPPGADGTPAAEDFIEGGLYDCGVGTIVYSTLIAYRGDGPAPETTADFFDLEKIPGKRGLRKGAKYALELALMADGVPPAEVYDTLATPEGVDRAFAKLDTIKDQVIWWEAGAQPPQLLADGEVVMTTAYNGRIFNAMIAEGQPFELFWPNQILDFNLFVIPKGAPNKEAAWDFIKWATDTQRLADQASFISYGPARKSSAPLVGLFKDGKTEMGPHMPTNPEHMADALTTNIEFWADHDIELSERFNAWLAAN